VVKVEKSIEQQKTRQDRLAEKYQEVNNKKLTDLFPKNSKVFELK